MMKVKIFILLVFLTLANNFSIAQQNSSKLYKKIEYPYDTIGLYLGEVDGVNAKAYKKLRKYSNRVEKLLNLKNLTKSKYNIEIRLYEEPNGANLIQYYYCTRLYLDTVIKIDRKKIYLNFAEDNVERESIEGNPIHLLNADSIFMLFSKNNVFSIQQKKRIKFQDAVFFNNETIESKITPLFGCPHCPFYRFEYKIANIYNSIYLEFLSVYNPTDPSNTPFDVKKKVIMNALSTNAHIEIKK